MSPKQLVSCEFLLFKLTRTECLQFMMVLFVELCSRSETWDIRNAIISFSEEETTQGEKIGYPVGTVGTITCIDYYDLAGPSLITCLDSESWSSLETGCDPSKNMILHLF